MRQDLAIKISQAIHDWRDAESRLLAEAPFEDIKKVEGKHLGLRVGIGAKSRKETLIVELTDLLTQLNDVAFEHHEALDYIEIVRVKTDDKEVITIEVVERTDKREISWLSKGE